MSVRYFMQLSYDGTHFCGWQVQPDAPSVQETIEQALATLLRKPTSLMGCGRTDTGVHAREFFAHFDAETDWDSAACTNFAYKLNCILPSAISIARIFPVAPDAHARFDAVERTYRYYISTHKNAFNFAHSYLFLKPLDVDKMNEAAEILLATEDFTSFSKLHTQVNNNRCEVRSAFWKREGDLLIFEITANRFLRNMVRAIVGTLMQVGEGKLSLEEFRQVIGRKDRCAAGASVPAHALFLEKVRYTFV